MSSTQSLPVLSGMPPHILDKIVGKLDSATRLPLRRLSQSLRSAVDHSLIPPSYEKLTLTVSLNVVKMRLEATPEKSFNVEFRDHQENRVCNKYEGRVLVWGPRYIERAASEVSSLFKHRGASVKELVVELYTDRYMTRFEELLEDDSKYFLRQLELNRFPHPWKVGSLNLSLPFTAGEMARFLELLEPEYLRNIQLTTVKGRHLQKVAQTEQWKRLAVKPKIIRLKK